MKYEGLEHCSLYQLKFLYYLRTEGGILDACYYSPEGCHRYLMTPEEYFDMHLVQLRALSCKYCHSLWHEKRVCPKLQAKNCTACGKQGHIKDHCRMSVADYMRRIRDGH